jgi:hypothetical protein
VDVSGAGAGGAAWLDLLVVVAFLRAMAVLALVATGMVKLAGEGCRFLTF